jgi:hypothetical protein
MNKLSVVRTCCFIGFFVWNHLFSKAEHLVCIPCSINVAIIIPSTCLIHCYVRNCLLLCCSWQLWSHPTYTSRILVDYLSTLNCSCYIVKTMNSKFFVNQHCSVFALLAPLTCFVLVSDIPGAPTTYKIAGSVHPSSWSRWCKSIAPSVPWNLS